MPLKNKNIKNKKDGKNKMRVSKTVRDYIEK